MVEVIVHATGQDDVHGGPGRAVCCPSVHSRLRASSLAGGARSMPADSGWPAVSRRALQPSRSRLAGPGLAPRVGAIPQQDLSGQARELLWGSRPAVLVPIGLEPLWGALEAKLVREVGGDPAEADQQRLASRRRHRATDSVLRLPEPPRSKGARRSVEARPKCVEEPSEVDLDDLYGRSASLTSQGEAQRECSEEILVTLMERPSSQRLVHLDFRRGWASWSARPPGSVSSFMPRRMRAAGVARQRRRQ